ncbi:MAG: LLM class flavin-dependent oxidoreductase [Janthinobacterium lividum]
MLQLSLLDYSPLDEHATARQALQATTQLAQRADALGFKRFWVSEHHSRPTLAGSNPELLMMYLAAHTQRIRIGSGGVLLPHYSAYKVAEGINLLETLYPGRIDLGTGRAPGGGQLAAQALNEGKTELVPYEQQVQELKAFLTNSGQAAVGYPGLLATPVSATRPELWTLGAGSGSADIAAEEGTSFIFAHFINASGMGVEAQARYRARFQPSAFLPQPHTMVAVFVAIAETSTAAEELARAFDHWLLRSETGQVMTGYPTPAAVAAYPYTAQERQHMRRNRQRILVGNPHEVKEQVLALAARYQTSEIMLLPNVSGAANRLKSIELLAEVFALVPEVALL